MRVLPISDVHLEFGLDPEVFVNALAEANVCVVAGDFALARFLDELRDDFRLLSEKFPHVIYVPGNHEYYKSDPASVDGVLRTVVQEFYNIHYLRPDNPITIDGQRFIGGTMWFPDGPNNWLGPKIINDFRMIKNFVPWVYEQNTIFRRMLLEELRTTDIVVSHHLPAVQSIHPQYVNDIGNMFFLSDQGRDISERQPKLWIHGHTHERLDYKLGETRVVCNPVGYPFEKKPFDPKFIIEV